MPKILIWTILSFVALAPTSSFAENEGDVDPNLVPGLGREVEASPPGQPKTRLLGPLEGRTPWGSQRGAKWIAASQFAVTLTANAPTLSYVSAHFYASPGSTVPVRYFAQLDVEPGSLVEGVECVYNDSSAARNVTFHLQKFSTNVLTGISTGVILCSLTTSGSAGIGVDALIPSPAETIRTTDGEATLFNYYLAADVAVDTSIAGCLVSYRRQVPDGPATATFADVPTTSPWFNFVEALVAAGVTGGCGGGNFCPDNPVTRGQMAVFLAAALGMGFPF